MWRLQHGESPKGLGPKAIVLLIGTNDLTYAEQRGEDALAAAVNSTAEHTLAIVKKLAAAAPQARVLLLALLPRGVADKDKKQGLSYPNM